MSGHTPGPWQREDGHKRQWIHPVGKPLSYVGMATGDSPDEIEANANLYAAAPDLLNALREMVAEKADYMIINNLGDPELQHTIKLARAAIAKAEGRSMTKMRSPHDAHARTIIVGGRNTTYDPEAGLWLRVRDRLSREGYDAHAVVAAVQRAIKAEGWTLRPPPETPALPDPDMANYHPEIGCCGP